MKLVFPDRTTWIVGLGTTSALAGQSASPWIVNGLAESGGLGAEQASFMVTAEMLAMGLVMIMLAPVIHRIPAKAFALGALVTIMIAQGLSVIADGVAMIAAARALSGLGFGTLFAIASAKGSVADDPERTYAVAGVMSLLIGVIINPLLGFTLDAYGYQGVFFGLALYSLLVALPLTFIPFGKIGRSMAVSAEIAPSIGFSKLAAGGVMVIMALLAIATNGVFVFVTTIAGSVGLKGGGLGSAMAVVSLVSSSGAFLASRLGTRLGTLFPLIGGLVVMGSSLCWLTAVTSQVTFWIAFTMLVTTYWFLWPYILGLAVSVDPAGRVVAATGSAKILAGGIGSAIAGYTAAHVGLFGYGLVALGCCVTAAVLAIYVVHLVKDGLLPGKHGGSDALNIGLNLEQSAS
jgi:predicted MFS family arabinose efflux permease